MTEPAPQGIAGSVKRGVAWSVGALMVSKALSLISLLVLASLLVPHEFGVVAAIAAYIALVELGSDLGMKPAIVYEAESGITDRVRAAYSLNILVGVTLSAIAVLAAPLVADLFSVGDRADLFRLGGLNIAITSLANVHDAVLLRDLNFSRRVRPQIARDVIRVSVSVGLALAGFGAVSLVWGFLAGTTAWVAMHWALTPLRPQPFIDRGIARSMASYGGAAALLEVLAVVGTRADVVAIGAFLNPTALGVYTVAYRIPEVLLASVAYALSVVAFPALSRKRGGGMEELGRATMTLLRYQVLYAFPIAAVMAVCADPLVGALFDARWEGAGAVMIPVCFALAGLTAIFPLGDLLKAVGKQKALVILNAVEIPLLVGVAAIAAPHGVEAVAWGIAIVLNVMHVAQATLVLRELKLRPGVALAACVPGVAAAGGVVAAGLLARLLVPGGDLAVLIGTAVAASAGGLLAARVLAPELVEQVTGQIRRVLPFGRPKLA